MTDTNKPEKLRWEVQDVEAVMAWAVEHHRLDLLTIDWKAVADLPQPLDEDDRIPGLTYEPAEEATDA